MWTALCSPCIRDVRTRCSEMPKSAQEFYIEVGAESREKYMRWESRKEIPFLSAIR